MRFLLIAILLLTGFFAKAQPPQDYFINPLNIPLVLSGTFGELRTNHFHSGIDIKTQGREGLNILATADGFVSRIKVQAGGYGNAIYIDHPNGYTTVYAHLKSFKKELADFVKQQQYAQQRFEVDLYPVPYQFLVNQGDIIAKSGNSGRSAAPHLHFEIRHTESEHPMNPLLFGIKVADSRKPNIHKVGITSINEQGNISNTHFLKNTQQNIQVKANKVGFEVHTTDKLDAAENNNGIYCLIVKHNDTLTYEFKMDRFSFDESKYINAHIDYPHYIHNSQKIHRAFILEGDLLSCHKQSINRGWIDISDGKPHKVSIEISDFEGNTSQRTITVQQNNAIELFTFPKQGQYVISPNASFYQETNEYSISINPNSIFKNTHVTVNQYKPSYFNIPANQCLGDVFEIEPETEVFFQPIDICFKLDSLNFDDSKKLIINQKIEKKKNSYPSTHINGNSICAHTRNFGKFYVGEDVKNPTLKPIKNYNGLTLKAGSTIQYSVSDNQSGLDYYHAFIDGEWVLLEYDLKSNRFKHTIESNLTKGEHEFFIVVTDHCGNLSKHLFTFKIAE